MFSTFLEREDYTIPAIIEELKQERVEARLIKASMDFSRYAAKIGSIVDALETAWAQTPYEAKGETHGK